MPDANLHVYFRHLKRTDLLEVLAIDQASFADAWTRADYLDRVPDRSFVMVIAALMAGDPVGFVLYRLHPRGIDILRMAVHPDYRREGVGSRLLARVAERLESWGRGQRAQVRIYVRERNLDAQLFLRARGLKAVWVEREHFADTGEDAFLMTCSIPSVGVARA